jgi:broad specificity phosphatase PhoE
MTELLMVRHGQAGPTPENYDQLSALGRDQALRLGRWLLAHERSFSTVLVGRMLRQQQTLAAIAEVYAEAGRPLPQAEVQLGLDEYRFVDLLRAFAQAHPDHPELAKARTNPADRRMWIGLLRITLVAWSQGTLQQLPESYGDFQQRIRASLTSIEQKLPSGPVLAVSSGGVMSQVAQQVLGFNDATFVDVNLQLLNTSVCEYRLTRSGLKLASLNTTPHLAAPDDRRLITLV